LRTALQFGEDEVNQVSILAWSPEHTDVKANTDGRTPHFLRAGEYLRIGWIL